MLQATCFMDFCGGAQLVVGSKQPGFVACGGCFTVLIQMGSRDSVFL
jgi:hypothetical protein